VNQAIQPRRRSLWGRAAVAFACAGVLTLTGLPGLTGTAYADKGKRCDQKWDLTGGTPGTDNLPWDHNIHVRAPGDWDSFAFDAPRQALDALTLPGDVENPTDEQIAEQKKFLSQYPKSYKEYPANSPARVYAQYRDYLNNTEPAKRRDKTFAKWLANGWILPNNNLHRGEAFERKVVKDMGLVGPDWLCNEEVQVMDKDGKPLMKNGKPVVRKFDAVNYKTNQFLEFKAGPGRDTKQDAPNKAFLEDPTRKNARVTYVNGESKDNATGRYLGRLAPQYGTDSSGRPRVTAYEHLTTSKPVYTRGPNSKPDTNFATPGSGNRAAGGASRVVGQSPTTPRDMAEQLRRVGSQGARGFGVRGPGGVDFSTLDLAYVGKPVKGKGLPYAFSAKQVDEEAGLGYGGEDKAQLISDAFFTWLALTPDKFWVNLNPDEPNRVMDATFGKTDAGRVLLQADLQMKHDYARDLDPREGLGKQYWDAMQAAGLKCGTGLRNWIVPKTAKVRADENGLYILDTPLKVNTVEIEFKTPSPNGDCRLTKEEEKTAADLARKIITPDIEKKVNTDPKYADLRRVYSARIAAEYVRQTDARTPTDYHKVINSNNVKAWPLRGANASWTPKKTYDDYVKSFTQGDYSYPCEIAGQQKTCIMGGVDFGKSPRHNIPRVQFQVEHKNLPKSTKTATQAMAQDADHTGMLLLGGSDEQTTGSNTPTPAPSHTSKPTGTPSTPAGHTPTPRPGDSSPAPGQGEPSTPPRDNNGGGGLATTGTQVLAVAGIAAVLLAAGASLIWWKRRRTTNQ